jgi:hypothetical protein
MIVRNNQRRTLPLLAAPTVTPAPLPLAVRATARPARRGGLFEEPPDLLG